MSKNPNSTTLRCSPFLWVPNQHHHSQIEALYCHFNLQPSIYYRGPCPKGHWYMYQMIIIIPDVTTLNKSFFHTHSDALQNFLTQPSP